MSLKAYNQTSKCSKHVKQDHRPQSILTSKNKNVLLYKKHVPVHDALQEFSPFWVYTLQYDMNMIGVYSPLFLATSFEQFEAHTIYSCMNRLIQFSRAQNVPECPTTLLHVINMSSITN